MLISKYCLGLSRVKLTGVGIQADISQHRKDCGLVGEIGRHLDVTACKISITSIVPCINATG
jgi:hypothetical protein